MKKIFLFFLVWTSTLLATQNSDAQQRSSYVHKYLLPRHEQDLSKPWIVYYSDKAPEKAFKPYNPIVFDSDFHPPIASLIEDKKVVLGYLSLGEISRYRSYFDDVKEDGVLLSENPSWPGSFFVDIRNPIWKERIIHEIIPSITEQGFNGLFLDTLDISLYLEESNPKKYGGMKEAAVNLIKEIGIAFPEMHLMMNRAYKLIPEVAMHLKMVLGDGIYTDYNFETKEYEKVRKKIYHLQRRVLHKAQNRFPHLEVFSLDFWNPKDTKMIKKIYAKERKNRFRPYVGNIELDEIVPEPK